MVQMDGVDGDGDDEEDEENDNEHTDDDESEHVSKRKTVIVLAATNTPWFVHSFIYSHCYFIHLFQVVIHLFHIYNNFSLFLS